MGQVPDVTYLLVGGGRLARHLQFYLRSLDLKLQTWTRREPVSEFKLKLGTASHVLLAIPDREIENFVNSNLGGFKGAIVHFSGSLVTPLAKSAHPLMTFAESLYPLEKYSSIPFIVEAGSKLSDLLPLLPNRSFKIDPAKKALYHAYCVMSGNFTTLLWEKFFVDLKTELGIPSSAASAYLKQIAQNLVDVAEGRTPSVLTGPLVRGDLATVNKNISALDKNFDPYAGVYRAFLTAESNRFSLNSRLLEKSMLEKAPAKPKDG